MKKVALMVLGTAMQTYGEKLADEQEVLSTAADIIIDVYRGRERVLRAANGRADDAPRQTPQRGVRQRRREPRRDRRADRRSPRWPTATRCARCSPRCAG